MERPDIVLVTVDSLRADCVGFLGDDTPATPNMDAVADEANVSTAATTPSSHTRASVPAILTSQYAHRFFNNFLHDVETPTIAQRLSEVGYSTAAFHSNPLLSRHFGYDQGFDTFSDGLRYVERTRLPETATRLYSKLIRLLRRFPYQPAETITRQAIDWLSEHQARGPKFLWVHYMDPHGPYALNRDQGYIDKLRSERLWHKAVSEPESVTTDEVKRLREAYHKEIEHTDRELAPLFDAIETYTDAVCTVLTGDHGEEFREHGEFTHMPKLYEEVTRVPFVLDLPHDDEVQTPEPISSLDIVPTLVGQMDDVSVASFEGVDLTAPEVNRTVVISETNPDSGDPLVGLRNEQYKYIAGGPEPELYDLEADPVEKTNLVNSGHEAESELERLLTAHLNEHDFEGGDKLAETAAEMNTEMQGRLEDLGYL
ncbi:sulfatase [Halosegnis marinus]|uniref:Sulfatase n=1 Tax=Halosegnis marinus TaxID=3034023 RepID=A0ABD5ZQH9_9EURY|nr:sulfatase [Halosegnis sp. DT85]